MVSKRRVRDLKEADLKGKGVFVWVDLNVPLDDNFNITDDTKIPAAVPTIKHLMDNGARVILSTHLGCPKAVTPEYSLNPLVPKLSELLGLQVKMANDCVGEELEKMVAELPNGGVLLLKNEWSYEEEKNDPEFAKRLASLADVYVSEAGVLMLKEFDYHVGAVANSKKQFAAIVGGSMISTKIEVIEFLLAKVDILFLVGGMIFTFYKARGYSVGSSPVEEDKLDLATSLIKKAKAKGVSLLLPTDVVIVDSLAADANRKIVPASQIPDGWMGLDIGRDSIKTFREALDKTKIIIWNGPKFENFATGTKEIAKMLAELSGNGVTTIIGGGDSVAAVKKPEWDLLVLQMITDFVEKAAMLFQAMMVNRRAQELEYEDGKLAARNFGLPPLYPSLGYFDVSTLQFIKNEDLEQLRKLGSGTFGTVYHGKWRGADVAIKRIKKSWFAGQSSEQEKLTIDFWLETVILSKLHHPNVVAFYGVVQDDPKGKLATVTEYMVDGSLRHALRRKDRNLDCCKRLKIAMDAALGMEYLHSKNIVHFDLKCDNLLVNLKDPSRPICKVADFGLSKIKRNTLVSGGMRGTTRWMAPELLNRSSSKVSEKIDVFSFGIVLWEIITGKVPYGNMHEREIEGGVVSNKLRPTIPSNCDPAWRRLMEDCWAADPAARPFFREIASRLRSMSEAAGEAELQGHKASK